MKASKYVMTVRGPAPHDLGKRLAQAHALAVLAAEKEKAAGSAAALEVTRDDSTINPR